MMRGAHLVKLEVDTNKYICASVNLNNIREAKIRKASTTAKPL